MNRYIKQSRKFDFGELLLYLAVFFPYIAILPLGTDLQPNALLISVVIFMMSTIAGKQTANSKLIQIIFSMLCVLVCVAISRFSFESLRSAGNYFTVFFVSLSATYYIKKHGLNESLIKFIILVWLVVGLLQFFIKKDLFGFLLSDPRTTANRGVISLASEPSFYGVTMVMFMFLVKNFKRHRFTFFALTIFQMLFLAQSSMGLILFCIFFTMYVLGDIEDKKLRRRLILIGILMLLALLIILLTVLKDTRFGQVTAMMLNGTINKDVSAIARFAAITESISGTFNNWFLPNGFEKRIMSGYGAALYELGVLSFPIIAYVTAGVVKVFKNKSSRPLLAVLFFIFMLGAIQLSHPMIGFVVGYGYCEKSIKLQGESNVISSVSAGRFVLGSR